MKDLWKEPRHVIVEVENRQCRVLEVLRRLGVNQFRVIDIRSFRGGLTRHLVELPPNYINKVIESNLIGIRGRCKIGGKTCLWFESEGCNVCNTILSHGSFLVSGRSVRDDVIVYNFVVPNFDSYKGILSAFRSVKIGFKLLKVGKFKSTGKILTRKQERILWLALKMGFFEYPRKVDTVELSRTLGISSSTLSETIRRGLRRLLEYYFES